MIKRIVSDLEKILCSMLLAIALIVLTLQILFRYLLYIPNQWSEELARYMFVWFIFLGMSYAVKENTHIRIEALLEKFPKGFCNIVRLLGLTVWFVFNMIIVFVGVGLCIKLFEAGQISQGFPIKMGYVYAAIPFGFALASIRLIPYLMTLFKIK